MPALLISTSMRAGARDDVAHEPFGIVPAAAGRRPRRRTSMPRDSRSARARSSSSASRAASVMRAPSRPSCRAMSRPSPREPPVISTDRPRKSIARPRAKRSRDKRAADRRAPLQQCRCDEISPCARRCQARARHVPGTDGTAFAHARDFHLLIAPRSAARITPLMGEPRTDIVPATSAPLQRVPGATALSTRRSTGSPPGAVLERPDTPDLHVTAVRRLPAPPRNTHLFRPARRRG